MIIVPGEIYIGYQMFYVGCTAPMMLEFAVLIVIPIVYLGFVYLGLTYLTFVSQE
jgi:hypothetical protein